MNELVRIHPSAFLADSARVYGRVELAERVSIWHNAVLRAECQAIRVGRMSNLQDFVMVHVGYGDATTVGEFCSIAHHATLHGCTIEDDCLIGMGATVLNGAVIGRGSLVAAGAVVLEGTVVPPGSLVAGVPGKVRRELSDAERDGIRRNAAAYLRHVEEHTAPVD